MNSNIQPFSLIAINIHQVIRYTKPKPHIVIIPLQPVIVSTLISLSTEFILYQTFYLFLFFLSGYFTLLGWMVSIKLISLISWLCPAIPLYKCFNILSTRFSDKNLSLNYVNSIESLYSFIFWNYVCHVSYIYIKLFYNLLMIVCDIKL